MLTKTGCTFAPDGPCLLGVCDLANQASSCLKTNFKSWLYFPPEKNVNSKILISPSFNVMTLKITWLLGYSQSSAAVEGASYALSPNPIASSILSPATLPWGQTARERWDHIPTRVWIQDSASQSVLLSQVRASPGTYRKCILPGPAWTCWIRSWRWRPATRPIYGASSLCPKDPRVKTTWPSDAGGPSLYEVSHGSQSRYPDTPWPSWFFPVSFLLCVVFALRKCLPFLVC